MTGEMSIERAKTHLEAWYDAELKVSTGQSYTIAGRTLTRVNLPEIRKQIEYWENRIARMKSRGRSRVRRIIPRDI
ncbi:DUF6148 family protein [Jeotgalibacillus terrae]|uniref:DUF6148 family protein n=1 Tax=Jeotgalibacillus terrae TaxID=587735 RepID=A0ABW5ZEP5_9BACL|nr:DUF6148 family protein [Jeotgalibacillus terrae]MBM7580019.1 hypothetical protein [Jeotgalibacillus terrae]